MAKIRTRKRGKTYSYIFEAGLTPDGKRRVVEKGGFTDKDAAYDAGVAAYNDWKHGNIGITSERINLKDFMISWLNNVAAINVRKGTLNNYDAITRNHIIPFLGSKYLQDLTPADIEHWMSTQTRAGFSYNTLKTAHTVLKLALNYAVHPAQLIQSNPAIYIKVPRNAPRNVVKRSIITKDEMAGLLNKYPSGTPIRIVLLLLYHTGMRIGEVLGLRWSDIDMEKSIIYVSDQLRTVSDAHYLAPPKTRTSKRNIIADPGLIKELQRWKFVQKENELQHGGAYVYVYMNKDGLLQQQSKELPVSSDAAISIPLICTQDNGRMMNPQYVFHYLKKEQLNAHSFRHTHATMLIEAGATPKGVAGRLGHANATITQNLYTHNTEKMQQDTAKIFQGLMKSSS